MKWRKATPSPIYGVFLHQGASLPRSFTSNTSSTWHINSSNAIDSRSTSALTTSYVLLFLDSILNSNQYSHKHANTKSKFRLWGCYLILNMPYPIPKASHTWGHIFVICIRETTLMDCSFLYHFMHIHSTKMLFRLLCICKSHKKCKSLFYGSS